MKLTTFYKNSLILIVILLLTGCVSVYRYFPVEPDWDVYDTSPVISYNKTDNTYTVTPALVNNSVKQKIYLDTISEWRKNNGIK